MCILRPPIADKTALIDALESAEIERIQVYEDVIDGSRITSHIKNDFTDSCRFKHSEHSVIVISRKMQNPKQGS